MKRSRLKSVWQSSRVPFVEQLESRTVLSVCGVECTLTGNILQIDASPSSDNVFVRFDPKSDSIHVVAAIPGGEESLGRFPAASVNMLNFTGFTSSDRYNVDQSIAAQIALDYTFKLDPSLYSIGPLVSAGAGNATLLAQNLSQAFSPGASSTSLQSLISHSTHSESTAEPYSSSHGEHGTLLSNGAGTAMPTIMAGDHGHEGASPVFLNSGPTAHSVSLSHAVVRQGGSSSADGQDDSMLEKHSESTSMQTQSESKLVPKRCTVTAAGGALVTSVYGKRECDCDQKKKAADEFAKDLSSKESETGTALTECVPCQSGAGLFGLSPEFQFCSVAPVKGGFVFPLLEEHHGSLCTARADSDEALAVETQWLESLQYVGWPLVAASVALLPALWSRQSKKDEEEKEDGIPAADWFFGRLTVEPLLAR